MTDNSKATYKDCYFRTHDGLKLYYRDYNIAGKAATTILCMPGLSRNSRDFDDIAAKLAPMYRVICADQRGRGRSDYDVNPSNYHPMTYVQDMVTLIEHINVSHLIALGTSLGGLMAMMMQSMKTNLFQAIILNDIGPEIETDGLMRIKSYVGKMPPPKTFAEAVAHIKKANLTVYPKFKDKDWNWFTRKLFRNDNDILKADYDPVIAENLNNDQTDTEAPPDLWPLFHTLTDTPMLVLHGALSDILTIKIIKKMQQIHTKMQVLTVHDVGHVPLMNTAIEIKTIQNFIRTYSA